MNDKPKIKALTNKQIQGGGGGDGVGPECGVPEEQFPLDGKCCRKLSSLTGTVYVKLCLYCRIFTSMPTGASLTVNHIFECEPHQYGKRI